MPGLAVLPEKKVRPESLDGLVLVSSPSVPAEDPGKVFYVATKISLETDRYESTIMLYDAVHGSARVLQSGPSDTCPLPSPDGSRYVFVHRAEQGQRQQKGSKLPGLELRLATPDSTGSMLLARIQGLASASWAPGSRRLVVAIATGRPDEDVKIVEHLPVWFNGKGYVYNTRVKPFIIDADSGAMEEIDLGLEWVQVGSVDWSPDGRYIAMAVSYDEEKPYLTRIYIYDTVRGEHWVLADGLSGYGEVAWSPDSKKLAYLGHRREHGFATHNKVIVFGLDGSEECLTCGLGRNASNTVNSDVRGPSCTRRLLWTRRGIVFLVSDHGEVKLYAVDEGGEPRPLVAPSGAVVDEFSATRSGELVAYTLMTPTSPKELYIYRDGVAKKVTRHTEAWTRRHLLSEPQRIEFVASDGEPIEGWVLRPPRGVEEKGWVLYIHGGPKTMWGYGFIHEFHVLASHGYTVVYVNPRGSDGYSEEFADIRCKYGERDYQDLMEAAQYAVEKLGLPKDKAAVMGGSYGGFMTNWVIGHTDFFRAAVTMRSISNWISMYGTTDIGWYFVEDQICCTPWRDAEKCWEKSPLKYADRVKTPTLIIHSDQDYRCWLDQALQLYTALKLHHVPTRLAIFPGESHDLSRSGKPKHRVKRLQLILEWLDKHLAGEKKEEQERKEDTR
ncbi:S9 family peptidase [Pyrofollis japonicus]|nr:S9 family peptidase [Pyrofollis japonicus]